MKALPPQADAVDAAPATPVRRADRSWRRSISMLISAPGSKAELAVQAAEQAPICSGVSKRGVPPPPGTPVERAP